MTREEMEKAVLAGTFSEFLKNANTTDLRAMCEELDLKIGKDKDQTKQLLIGYFKKNKPEEKEEKEMAEVLQLKTNPKYLGFVPRPEERDYEALKQSILREGLLETIKVKSDGTIVDGNTRFQIFTDLGKAIPQEKIEIVEFKDENAVEAYIYSENIARRHLSDIDKIALARKFFSVAEIKEETEKERKEKITEVAQKKKEAKAKGEAVAPVGKKKEDKSKRTSAKIAKKAGVSQAQVEREEFIRKYWPEKLEEGKAKGQAIGDIYSDVKELWDVVRRFDKDLLKDVQDGKITLKDAYYKKVPNEVKLTGGKTKVEKIGPVEKTATEIRGIVNKVFLKRHDGKEEEYEDFEKEILERIDSIITEAQNKKR